MLINLIYSIALLHFSDFMDNIELKINFDPQELKQNVKNEFFIILNFSNTNSNLNFWCECDLLVKHPLSLAHDKVLDIGRTRVGIIEPKQSIEKRIKIYTRPNNYPGEYELNLTAYLYDKEGIISERIDRKETIICK